jgi:hypothetical protein
VYVPLVVPAGRRYVAAEPPFVTVPDVTGFPTAAPLLNIVNVTVPAFTVPAVLFTVAESDTFCALALKFAIAFDAVTIVAAPPIVRVWVLSVLVAKFPPAL